MWFRVVTIGILVAALFVPPTIEVTVTSRMASPVLLRFEGDEWRELGPHQAITVPVTRWRWHAFAWRRGDRNDPLDTGRPVPLPIGDILLHAGSSFVLLETGAGGADA